MRWSVALRVVTVTTCLAGGIAESCDGLGMLQIEKAPEAPFSAVIFYNLYIRSEDDIPRVAEMVQEQFSFIPEPSDKEIRINSIGALWNLSSLKLSPELEARSKLLAHYKEGFEDITLHDMWSFCKNPNTHPEQLVVYLHSKGSFHSWHGHNGVQRQYVSSGALTQECLNMPKECNVCSSRMTPTPHPHTPGNMWAARCGYIAKLIDPKVFGITMSDTTAGPHNGLPWCLGRGRWANEHWVNSHPDAAPCDLDTNPNYISGPAPSGNFTKELKRAPRFEQKAYHATWGRCVGMGELLEDRLAEYRFLYHQEPNKDWWGWRHFATNATDSGIFMSG